MAEHLLEAALVMIETLLRLIVDGADIDHDIAGVENGGVTSALQICSE